MVWVVRSFMRHDKGAPTDVGREAAAVRLTRARTLFNESTFSASKSTRTQAL